MQPVHVAEPQVKGLIIKPRNNFIPGGRKKRYFGGVSFELLYLVKLLFPCVVCYEHKAV